MAAFIAKQMMGDKLNSVKGAMGDKDKDEGDGDKAEEGEEDPEIAEARRELEEKRKEKHRRMEEERETMRQSIRDKYGLKKKVEEVEPDPMNDPELAGRLGRKKKTPAELAAEANMEDDEDAENSFLPANMSELGTKVGEIPGKVAASMSEATEKCVVQ